MIRRSRMNSFFLTYCKCNVSTNKHLPPANARWTNNAKRQRQEMWQQLYQSAYSSATMHPHHHSHHHHHHLYLCQSMSLHFSVAQNTEFKQKTKYEYKWWNPSLLKWTVNSITVRRWILSKLNRSPSICDKMLSWLCCSKLASAYKEIEVVSFGFFIWKI